ncbi:hypothetical protein ACN47E_000440 [Coniothyrium glycines]
MRSPPLEVLLSWPKPNYENPKTRGPALVIVNSICITLVIVVVALRLYTRLVIKRWFGLDDIFILLALAFTIGLTAIVLLANKYYGWDRHVWDIPSGKFAMTLKIAMVAKIVFTAAATFTRLSLHWFYYRLVSDSGQQWFRWLVHANVVYTVCIFISFIFISIFQCNPVRNYWIIGVPPGSCVDEGIVTLVCGIINCVADFATTVTPIPLIMGLHMPRRQRLAVAVLFGLGIVVTVAGVVRTWYIYRSLIGEYDQTWYAYPLWIAAAIEIDLGVICASAPVLRPFMANIPSTRSHARSRGLSNKKSADYASYKQTSRGSQKLSQASAISSKGRLDSLQGVLEVSVDKGKSYEMKHWDEAERRIMEDDAARGSQEAILEIHDDGDPRQGMSRMWEKVRKSATRIERKEDMTITRTSEVELQIESASGANARRVSRYAPQHTPANFSLRPPV